MAFGVQAVRFCRSVSVVVVRIFAAGGNNREGVSLECLSVDAVSVYRGELPLDFLAALAGVSVFHPEISEASGSGFGKDPAHYAGGSDCSIDTGAGALSQSAWQFLV